MTAADPETILKAVTLLGIEESASLHDIRKRYHEKLKHSHPDTFLLSPEQTNLKTIL